MKYTMAILIMGFGAAACGKPVQAQVDCKEHLAGFACGVTTHGGTGKTYNVCWDIDATCADGQRLSANTCQEVGGDGQASSVVPNNKFTGGQCKVGRVTGVSVAHVKIAQR